LKSWDALPSKVEAEEIKPLLTWILDLRNVAKKELSGTQLMVFFLQCHIQPLQARISKLWTYLGAKDPSRVSPKDPLTKFYFQSCISFYFQFCIFFYILFCILFTTFYFGWISIILLSVFILKTKNS
jgi:hypothetical protein